MDFIVTAVKIGLKNAETLWYVGAIMVSTVIMVIGLLKKPVFNHIKNKDARRTLLALTNIILSYAATACYFWVEGLNWRWYWIAGFITTVTSILTYFLYENFWIRNLVHTIGEFTIDKLAHLAKLIFSKSIGKSDKSIKAEFKQVTKELEHFAKVEIKSATKKLAKADKELENL
jgi:hypothetical protein